MAAILFVTLALLLSLACGAHLWFSTQTIRSRWRDIHPYRRRAD